MRIRAPATDPEILNCAAVACPSGTKRAVVWLLAVMEPLGARVSSARCDADETAATVPNDSGVNSCNCTEVRKLSSAGSVVNTDKRHCLRETNTLHVGVLRPCMERQDMGLIRRLRLYRPA